MHYRTLLLLLLAAPLAAQTPDLPRVAFLSEFGLVRTWQDDLSPLLERAGLASVPDESLTSLGWRFGMGTGDWTVEVASARVSNTNLGFPAGERRTRLVVDQTSIGFGGRWEPLTGVVGAITVGVQVDKLLLHTYRSDTDTPTEVWTATGQSSFQSDWNWTPQATVRLAWRFAPLSDTAYGYALGLGVTGGYRVGDMAWKLGGDVPVTGLTAPWRPWARVFVTLGAE